MVLKNRGDWDIWSDHLGGGRYALIGWVYSMRSTGATLHICCNHMVDERCGKVFFGTCLIQILIIDTYFYGALLFIHRDRVGHSRGIGNWVDEPNLPQLVNLSFYIHGFGGVNSSLFLSN